MRRIWTRFLLVSLLALVATDLALAQSRDGVPEKGRFLVAREDLGDPNFFRTVVLMLDYSAKGAMGVIVNRPTSVRMGEVFPKLAELSDRPETAYLGGPVELEGVVLVVRHRSHPEGFHSVSGDLYTGASVDALAAILADGADPASIRAYAGYAGWGPGQLDREIEQGSWLVMPATPEQVFDPNPQDLWRKLIQSSRTLFAGLGAEGRLN